MPSSSLMITCVECRIRGEWQAIFTKAFGERYELTSPGGILDIACSAVSLGEIGRPFHLQQQINRTISLASIDRILLCNHGDCAAYKDKGISFSEHQGEEEKMFQIQELQKAEIFLRRQIPVEISIDLCYFDPRTLQIENVPLAV